MSDLTRQLEEFVHTNGREILKRFNDALQKHPETEGLTVDQARISYAGQSARKEPRVERIEGGWIIWK